MIRDVSQLSDPPVHLYLLLRQKRDISDFVFFV